MRRAVYSNARAREVLGWEPRVTRRKAWRARRHGCGGDRAARMMVVMTPQATEAEIAAVVEKLEARGVHAKVMPAS